MSASDAAAMFAGDNDSSNSLSPRDADNFVDEANRENHALEHPIEDGHVDPIESLSDTEKQAYIELKEALSDVTDPYDQYLLNPPSLLRYLRARKFDVKAAEKMLRHSIQWRRDERPEKARCSYCDKYPGSHSMRPIGYDKLGRVVVYSCFATATEHSPASNKEHLIFLMEKVCKLMRPGTEKWVQFVDFQGFGAVNLNPMTAKIANSIFADHYPERLGNIFLVDPPLLFRGLWRMLRPIVDSVTAEKIRFVKHSDVPKLLEEFFDDEMAAWIQREMVENRDKHFLKVKTSWLPADPSIPRPSTILDLEHGGFPENAPLVAAYKASNGKHEDITADPSMPDPVLHDPRAVNTFLKDHPVFYSTPEGGWKTEGEDDA